ncbi:hypothetical protein [Lacunimicrobium album]
MPTVLLAAGALIVCLAIAITVEEFQAVSSTTAAQTSQTDADEAETSALLAAAQPNSPILAAQFNAMFHQVSKTKDFTGCYRVIDAHDGVVRDIELKLANLITVDFNETPLNQAITNIGSQLGLSVVINEISLSEEGIPLDEPITLQLSQPIRASAAVKQILYPLGLTSIIENDLLTIVTETAADEKNTLRIYDVRGLGLDDFNEMMMLKKAIEKNTGDEFAWDEDGGTGSLLVIPGGLIVRQTSKVHQEIEATLNMFQEFVKSPSP